MISCGDDENLPIKTDSVHHRIQLLHQLDTNQCPKSLTLAKIICSLPAAGAPRPSPELLVLHQSRPHDVPDRGQGRRHRRHAGVAPVPGHLAGRAHTPGAPGPAAAAHHLDYSLTNLLAAVLIALTFGQLGDSKDGMPNFFTQLSQVRNTLAN